MAGHLKPRGGRPELPPEERRNQTVALRFTPAEMARLRAAAADRGRSLAAHVRDVLAAAGVVPPAGPDPNAVAVAAELRRIGVNLNTALRTLHQCVDDAANEAAPAVRDAALAVALRLAELAPEPPPEAGPPSPGELEP